MLNRFIYITTQKEFIHQYKDAPEEVYYLRYPHRHMLYVKVQIEVFNNDRELEFIMIKHNIDSYLDTILNETTNRSCETIGNLLIEFIRSTYCDKTERHIKVDVSEDNENGAILEYFMEAR